MTNAPPIRFRLPFLLLVTLAASVSLYAQQPKPAPAAGQEVADDEVLQVSTTLVTVPVRVLDRQGRFIADLKQEQFQIYEDGVEQEIAYFEDAEQPFTVALLLDISDSTKFKLKEIQDAAAAFVEQLRPCDRVILVAFDQNVTILTEATSDRGVLTEAIRRTQTGGGTSLYTALDRVVKEQLSHSRGRKAIVLFTDGVDTTSKSATYESTLRAAEELDALVYTIQYNTYNIAVSSLKPTLSSQITFTMAQVVTSRGEPLSVAYARANEYLHLLAYKTGGRFYYADTVAHLTKTFARIAQELRQQYSLGYYPKNQTAKGERRQIKVRVNATGAAVRTRRSYIYKPKTGVPAKQ